MDIRSLRYFLAVADEGGFRAGARRVGVSQPAISQGIALLEEEIGTRLFDRVSRRAIPTAAGALLLEPARRLVADFDGLAPLIDRSRGVVRGRLEIGTTDAASIHVLPKVYRAFRRRHAEVELSVRVEGTAPLLAQLAAGSIELALVNLQAGDRTTPLPAEGFGAEPLYREELVPVVAKGHPLGKRRRVSLADVAATPLLTFKRDSITRQALEARFQESGLELRVAMEISSPEAIKKLVEVGLGASVLPARSVRPEIRAGSLVPLRIPGWSLARVLGVVRDERRSASPAAGAFLELAERVRNVPPRGGSEPPGSGSARRAESTGSSGARGRPSDPGSSTPT